VAFLKTCIYKAPGDAWYAFSWLEPTSPAPPKSTAAEDDHVVVDGKLHAGRSQSKFNVEVVAIREAITNFTITTTTVKLAGGQRPLITVANTVVQLPVAVGWQRRLVAATNTGACAELGFFYASIMWRFLQPGHDVRRLAGFNFSVSRRR